MSAAETADHVGAEGNGGRYNDHDFHSAHAVSSRATEQAREPVHTPQEKREPAGNTAGNLRTQTPGNGNSQQENERAPQEEAMADLGAQDPDASSSEQGSNGEQEDLAVSESRGQTPESIGDQQESEQEEDWEEIGSIEEDRPDSDSDGEFNTSSGFEADSNSEDKAASGTAESEENLPFGCAHYRRKCKVVAPCCDKIFWCRHCHNEAETDLSKAHEIDRHAVEEVICAACETRQPVSNKCVKCDIIFGKYYCPNCKFWDDQGEKKKVYHCDQCGICRSGGRSNYFHCPTCGSCYPLPLQNKHKCLENAMRRQCPVCLEDMFSSLRQSQVLLCGHTIHSDCLRLLQKQRGLQAIRCPMCSKSIADYSEYWKQLSEEMAQMPLEEAFQRRVRIVCNDCLERSTTDFHFLGLKCTKCNSFNTRDIADE